MSSVSRPPQAVVPRPEDRDFLITLQAHNLRVPLARRFSLIAQVHIREANQPGSASKRPLCFVLMRVKGDQEARDRSPLRPVPAKPYAAFGLSRTIGITRLVCFG